MPTDPARDLLADLDEWFTPEARTRVVRKHLDAAELRGHTRAVNETAIASIHKAVAAERAAIVAYLRAHGDNADDWHVAADAIEAGEHTKENPDAV